MHKLQEDVASCVPGFTQQAGIAALDSSQDCVVEMVADYDRRRQFVVQGLNEIDGITCLMPKGAFYVFPNVSSFGRTSEEVAIALLRNSEVICVPGTAFGSRGEGYLRISYAASMEQLKEGVARIKEGATTLAGVP
jgi:aminotransferase